MKKEILDMYITAIQRAYEDNKLEVDVSSNTVEGEPDNGYRTFELLSKTITFTIKN